MKEEIQQDERIMMKQKDFKSIGLDSIFYFLLIAIVIQKIFLNAPIKQYGVELFLFLICLVYEIVGYYKAGINIWICDESGKRIKLLRIVIEGVVTCGIMILLMGIKDLKDIILCVLFSILIYGSGILITAFAINKRKRKIDLELDNEKD